MQYKYKRIEDDLNVKQNAPQIHKRNQRGKKQTNKKNKKKEKKKKQNH